MKQMSIFRGFLASLFLAISVYSSIVLYLRGFTFFGEFFGDVAKFKWAGQFDVDFIFVITLCSLWVAWRNDFTLRGMILATMVYAGGTWFLTSYLMFLSMHTTTKTPGPEIIVGPRRIKEIKAA